MAHRRFRRPKPRVLLPSLVALAFIIACQGAPSTSAPEANGEAQTPTPVTEVLAPGVAAATPAAEATRAPAMQIKYGGIVPMHAYAAPVTGQPLIEATYGHLQNISPLYNGLLMLRISDRFLT